MADYGALFQLMLVALALAIAGVFFIVYLLILSLREKKRLDAARYVGIEMEAGKEETLQCLYYFGYLGGIDEHQPIPDECSGCMKKVDCMKKTDCMSERRRRRKSSRRKTEAKVMA